MGNNFFLIVFTVLLCSGDVNLEQKLSLGGLFEDIELHKTAFFYETRTFNKEIVGNDSKLDPLIHPESLPNHAFSALKSFCSFLNQTAVGIFGAQTSSNLQIVQNLSEKKRIPLILTRWVNNEPLGDMTLNFYPDPELLTQAYMDIVTALEWDSLTVIYTDSASFLRISSFIKLAKDNDIPVYVENVDPYHTSNYRPILRNLRESGRNNFVIDSPMRHLRELLSQLQQVGMLTANYNYFLTNLDVDTQDLDQFMYNEAVLTGIHLVKPKGEDAIGVTRELCHLYQVTFDDNCMSRVGKDFPELDVETALIMDAVQWYVSALKTANITSGRSIKCDSEDTWEHGMEVYDILKELVQEIQGVEPEKLSQKIRNYVETEVDIKAKVRAVSGGAISFGDNGYRNVFELVIFQIKERFTEKGIWNTTIGLNITLDEVDILDLDNNMFNTNLLVEITLAEPFVMLRENADQLRGNDRYEGFAIDLIERISRMEGFKYTLVLRNDRINGVFNSAAGKWIGMIGDILERKVDMAISDLTITGERMGPVEFTQPYMSLGITILFHSPVEEPPSFFYFLQPLSKDFLIALGLAYLAVVFSFFIIGRLSRSNWTREKSCESYLYNQLTLKNSFWFVTGSLFKQNTQLGLRSLSARILAGAWWSFCFVTVAMYIAYSMVCDTAPNKTVLFNNVEELVAKAESHQIKFGAKLGGATESFFKRSSDPVYQEIAAYMEEHPEDMALTMEDAVIRAKNERYAYFMESSVAEYVTARHCDLTTVGGLLDSKGYGIAVPKDSPYLTALNKAILKLGSRGELNELKQKWWEDIYNGAMCDIEEVEEATPRDLEHFTGLLYITVYGIVFAFICSFIEFHKNVKRVCKVHKLPYGKVFCSELRRNFGGSTKRIVYVPKSTDGPGSIELLSNTPI